MTIHLINLTDHPVNLFNPEGTRVLDIIPPSGKVARVVSNQEHIGDFLIRFKPVANFNIPEPVENTYYIVSNVVRAAFPDRKDLCSPNAPVKNSNGANIGCRSLMVN